MPISKNFIKDKRITIFLNLPPAKKSEVVIKTIDINRVCGLNITEWFGRGLL